MMITIRIPPSLWHSLSDKLTDDEKAQIRGAATGRYDLRGFEIDVGQLSINLTDKLSSEISNLIKADEQ